MTDHEKDTYKRRLFILEQIYEHKTITIENLLNICHSEKFEIHDKRPLEHDLCELSKIFPMELVGDPVHTVNWLPIAPGILWNGSAIGERLGKGNESKLKLAKCVVDIIESFKPSARSLLLGTGTTVYEVAREIIRRRLAVSFIYSNNLLVLYEIIRCNPPNIGIELPQGQLKRDTGMIINKKGINHLRKVPVDTVITSFNGISYDYDFTSDDDREEEEKQMNLCPHANCKRIIIPISWDKIGVGGKIVAKKKHLDTNRRQYIIVTDPPKNYNKEDLNKLFSLKEGVVIKYAE